ncbi:MAG: tyrosine-type recombinase/integrase [Verrucomicrobiota bacterium]|jgi:site-specific recombinase XerD
MSMETLLENHLELLRVRHFSPQTVKCREHSIKMFFEHLKTSGVADLREVSRDTIQDYQLALMRRYPSATVRHHMSSLRQFFAQLENTDAILLNPTAGVPLPKWERRLPKRILTPAEVRKLLNAPDETPKGLRDKALLELFYSSGIRREEMTRLTLPDVDIRNGFVRVQGKGSKERIVPVGQSACEAIGRYLKDARNVWLKAPRNPGWTDALWLSPIQPHGPLKKEAIALIILRHARRVLGRNVSPHVWRHTFATHLVSNGSNVVYVQRLLGHKSLKTTDIYTRVTMTDLKKTLQRTHPRTEDAAATAAVTREDAAQMPGGHRHNATPNP